MAKATVHQKPSATKAEPVAEKSLVDDGLNVTLCKKRRLVALEAAWETEQLCEVLRTTLVNGVDSSDLAARGITIRIEQLSQIVMQALNDEVETGELAYSLRMKREEVAA